MTRALVVTDPHLAAIGLIDPVVEAIRAAGVEAEVFAGSGVEPSEASVAQAVEAAREGGFDGFVGLGGGSSIDTAKIAALLSTHPGGIYDYLNPPIGKGTPVPGPLLPLFGVPTTGGTGAEATTVAIIDLPEHHVKTGISHAHLRPLLGIVDPDLTLTTPRAVTASVGLDVLCHAIESYTAIAYDARPRAASPDERPPYQGANPVSDVWSEQAIALAGGALRSAIADGSDHAARSAMALAASAAGRAFGQAGVHIPHACSYPVAGLKHEWKPPGLPGRGALRAARLRGRADRARVVPLHRAGRARAPPPRRRAAHWASPSTPTITTRCRARSSSSCATSARPAGCASSATARPTCPSSSPARSSSSACSCARPARSATADLEAILRASL